MNKFLSEAYELEEELINVRRALHKNPECGIELDNTLNVISGFLRNYGYKPNRCGGCSLVADIGVGDECVLLRADTDALNIKEETDLDFRSENGCMHACGHDIHTSMLLGAAALIKRNEHRMKRRVKLLFQGGEEILFGAKDAIDHGILLNPSVDFAFMIHTVVGADLPVGSVILPPAGVIAPSAHFFKVLIFGKNSHGAEPEKGVDAMRIAAEILSFLYEIKTLFGDTVLTVGSINGGRVANVIADRVELSGTFRTPSDRVQESVERYISDNVKMIANRHGGRAEMVIDGSCPTFVNDVKTREKALNIAAEILGEDRVHPTDAVGGGSEDFACFSHAVPSTMLAMSADVASLGVKYPLHNPKVVFSEEVIKYGAAIYGGFAFL